MALWVEVDIHRCEPVQKGGQGSCLGLLQRQTELWAPMRLFFGDFSECGARTSSISITWELVKNLNAQDFLQSHGSMF